MYISLALAQTKDIVLDTILSAVHNRGEKSQCYLHYTAKAINVSNQILYELKLGQELGYSSEGNILAFSFFP